MNKKLIARVVTSLAIDREFDYRIPEHLLQVIHVGTKVRVPFGRSSREGYVVGFKEKSSFPNLKEIAGVDDVKGRIPPNLVRLARWMADYYCCSREQAVKSVLPAAVRSGRVKQKMLKFVALNADVDLTECLPEIEKKAPKQAAALQTLVRLRECSQIQLQKESGADYSTIRRLEEKKLVIVTQQSVERDPFADDVILPTTALKLTEKQRIALEDINRAVEEGEGRAILLYGVTGSGKTEVYLQAISKAMENGLSAIVLVPEIALTPQTTERFRARFGDKVSVLHSGLSEGERYDEWMKAKDGKTQIVVGARSALFAPYENLGLIIVDEEHENTYKQDEAPRYNARDVAVVRGKLEKAAVVLGSATPALESYYNCDLDKYSLSELPERVDNQRMPTMELVDMRAEAMLQGGAQIFSKRLISLVNECLEDGNQVMMFLNRRGYATQMMCTKCGFVATCPDCNLAYTYHRSAHQLVCHLCGKLLPAYPQCPACKSNDKISYSGLGTEKVESIAHAVFPKAVIARMDSDTMTRKSAYKDTLNAFRAGRINILIGTQMIAKGLHFPNVTLVGVIFADLGLHIPDFRAGERTFQLLTQVAGRAGRGDVSGRVVVQSYTPFHPALQHAMEQNFNGFYSEEIEMRKMLSFPPAVHMVIIHFRGEEEKAVKEAAEKVAAALTGKLPEEVIVGEPIPSPLPKVRANYRFQISMRGGNVLHVVRTLRATVLPMRFKGVSVNIDVDPQSLS